jgi:hypothetical protein
MRCFSLLDRGTSKFKEVHVMYELYFLYLDALWSSEIGYSMCLRAWEIMSFSKGNNKIVKKIVTTQPNKCLYFNKIQKVNFAAQKTIC